MRITADATIAQNDSGWIPVSLTRTSYSGSVTLVASGLPNGVELRSTIIPAGTTETRILLVAAATADTGSRDFSIFASASGVATVTVSGKLTVQPSGFRVTVRGSDSISVARGDSTRVTLDITRFGSFRGALELDWGSLPAGVISGNARTVAPGATTHVLQLTAQPVARRGTASVSLVARATGQPDASRLLQLTVRGVDTLTTTFVESFSMSRPAAALVRVYVGRSIGFPEPVTLEAFGLPPGASATFEPAIVPPNVSLVTMRVVTTADTWDGTFQVGLRGLTAVPAQVNIFGFTPMTVIPPKVSFMTMTVGADCRCGGFGLLAGTSEKAAVVLLDRNRSVITGRTPKFSVDDPKVATVSEDGTVSARQAGSALLTATIDGVSTSLRFYVFPDLHNSLWRGAWSASVPVTYSGASWVHRFTGTSTVEISYTRKSGDWRDGYTRTAIITAVQEPTPRGPVSSSYVLTDVVTENGSAWIDGNFTTVVCRFGCGNITRGLLYVYITKGLGTTFPNGMMPISLSLVDVTGRGPNYPEQEINFQLTRVR
jgi:hypothetical protein